MEEGDDNGDEVQDTDRKLLMRLNVSWNELGTQDDLIKAGVRLFHVFRVFVFCIPVFLYFAVHTKKG